MKKKALKKKLAPGSIVHVSAWAQPTGWRKAVRWVQSYLPTFSVYNDRFGVELTLAAWNWRPEVLFYGFRWLCFRVWK